MLFHHIHPHSQLHVIGRGKPSYQEQLNRYVNSLATRTAVIFHGYLQEKQKYAVLAKSWALLSTSLKEGFGLNVLEAATVKTPTLAYNIPGIRDAVITGQTGMLTKDNTPKALANLMEKYCESQSLRSILGNKAQQYAKKFTWEKTTDQFLEAVKDVIKKR